MMLCTMFFCFYVDKVIPCFAQHFQCQKFMLLNKQNIKTLKVLEIFVFQNFTIQVAYGGIDIVIIGVSYGGNNMAMLCMTHFMAI